MHRDSGAIEQCLPDQMPPHSLDAEQCLLGSIILGSQDAAMIAEIRSAVTKDAFFQADHAVIFETAIEEIDAGRPLDAIILREALKRRGVLEEVGGIKILSELLGKVPSYAHGVHYAGIVREKWILRSLIQISNETIRACYAPTRDATAMELVTSTAGRVAEVATAGGSDRVWKLDEVVMEVIEQKENGTQPRISTGLRDLDTYIGGLRKGGKTIIAGKPGMGKSQLIKQIALNIARSGTPVGIISVEETRHKIGENMLANQSGLENHQISYGRLSPEDFVRLVGASAPLSKLPIYIVDSAPDLGRIRAMAQILALRHGCEAIFVDHLHIIDAGEETERMTRERQVSRISAALKQLWKQLNVAGIEAAQLNRAGGNERPELANLRDSGSLEQDADVVIMLHRQDYYRSNPAERDGILEALVRKNKDGRCVDVPLAFFGATQQIDSLKATPADVARYGL